jgi:hypothetical protein
MRWSFFCGLVCGANLAFGIDYLIVGHYWSAAIALVAAAIAACLFVIPKR